jgi:photosystem II stability/assembly factor-like uncharacterized protein
MEGLCFLEDRVCVHEAGSVEGVAANGYALPIWSIGEGRSTWPGDLALRYDRATPRGIGSADQLWAVRKACVQVVDCTAPVPAQPSQARSGQSSHQHPITPSRGKFRIPVTWIDYAIAMVGSEKRKAIGRTELTRRKALESVCRATHYISLLALTLPLLCGIAASQTLHSSYGILRSTDNGKSWKQGFRGDFDADHLVIDKSGHILATTMIVTPNRMFSELYASHEGSESWKRVTLPRISPNGDLILDLLATPDGSIFALLNKGILRTVDGGSTWTVAATTMPVAFRSLRLGPNQSLLGFAPDGLYQSTDGGKNWQSQGFEGQELDGGITLPESTVLVTFQCRMFVASLSQARSSEWLHSEDDCPNSHLLASNARGPLFANTPHGVLKFDMAGKTWKKVLAFKDRVEPIGIAVSPDGDVYAVILKGGSCPTLFRSTDAGETWQAVKKLGPGVTSHNSPLPQTELFMQG